MFSMNEKVDTLATLMEIQNRRADRIEKSMGGLDSRLKRSQTQTEKYISAFQEQMNEIQGLVQNVFDLMATKADLREYATKNDMENIKEVILGEVRPVAKAFDKDAVTLIDYGKRIVVLEREAGVTQ